MVFKLKIIVMCLTALHISCVRPAPPKTFLNSSDPIAIPAFYRAVFDVPQDTIRKIFLHDHIDTKQKHDENEEDSNQLNILNIQEIQDAIASHMSFNELANLADAADRARNQNLAVESRFKLTELIFKQCNQLLNSFLKGCVNQKQKSQQIIAECTRIDENEILSDKTIVLKLISLFKTIGTINMNPGVFGNEDKKDIFSLLARFDKQIGNPNEKIFKPFVRLLTIDDHFSIIRYFKNNRSHHPQEHLNIYFYILYASKDYLKNRFPFCIMLIIHELTISMNNEDVSKKLKDTFDGHTLVFEPKHKLDWTLYRETMPTNEEEKRFYLNSAKKLMREKTALIWTASYTNLFGSPLMSTTDLLKTLRQLYCAFKNLTPFEKEAVDAANLNLALFEEKSAEPDVEKMLKSLINDCAGPKTLGESTIAEQLKALNKWTQTKNTEVEYYKYLNFVQIIYSTTAQEVKGEFYARIKQILDEPLIFSDLSKYIDLIKATRFLHFSNVQLRNINYYLYQIFFKFAQQPKFLKNMKRLQEVNQLHIDLQQKITNIWNEETFGIDYKQLLAEFLKNFDGYLKLSKKDDKNQKFRQMICLKFWLVLIRRAHTLDEAQNSEVVRGHVLHALKFLDRLVCRDGTTLSYDDGLVVYAIEFLNYFHSLTYEFYYKTAKVKPLFQSFAKSEISRSNPLTYLLLLEIIKIVELVKFHPLPDQILENILIYEAHVDDAIDHSLDFYFRISGSRLTFYSRHVDEVRKKQQTNLNKFIGKMISLIIDLDLSHSLLTYRAIQLKIFKAIFDAIEANPNAEALINLETKLNLERKIIEWRIYPLNERHFVAELEPDYNKWQERLKKHKDAEDKTAFEQR